MNRRESGPWTIDDDPPTTRWRGFAYFLDFPMDLVGEPLRADAWNEAADRPYRISEAQMRALLLATEFASVLAAGGAAPFDLVERLCRLDTWLRLSRALPRATDRPPSEESAPVRLSDRPPEAARDNVPAFAAAALTSESSMVGCTSMVGRGDGSGNGTVSVPSLASAGAPSAKPASDLRCSFCGVGRKEVFRMVEGATGVVICNGCVNICVGLIGEQPSKSSTPGDAEYESWSGIGEGETRGDDDLPIDSLKTLDAASCALINEHFRLRNSPIFLERLTRYIASVRAEYQRVVGAHGA